MIIGTGLIARAFSDTFEDRSDVAIHAAGVANSACRDEAAFARERHSLTETIHRIPAGALLVYFGTCSVADPGARDTPYVRHKLAMEALVAQHTPHLNIRLPQIAAPFGNPHTLLSFLFRQISSGQSFEVFRHARRNILGIDDVVALSSAIVRDQGIRNQTISLAHPEMCDVTTLVTTMERALGRRARFELVDKGDPYTLDGRLTETIANRIRLPLGPDYLHRTINRYYGTDSAV